MLHGPVEDAVVIRVPYGRGSHVKDDHSVCSLCHLKELAEGGEELSVVDSGFP